MRQAVPQAPGTERAEPANEYLAFAAEHAIHLAEDLVRVLRVLERMRQQHGLDRAARDRQGIVARAYCAGTSRVRRQPAPMLRSRAG